MDVVFHRLIQKDLKSALFYYDSEGGTKLGDRFFEDVEVTVSRIQSNPRRFHFISDTLRRAPLQTFPYHILYEENPYRIKILVLRHDKRHPKFKMRRK